MSHLPAAARPARCSPAAASLLVIVVVAACSAAPSPSANPPSPSGASPSGGEASPSVTANESPPIPLPTPTYTNPPDRELAGLIPTRLRGVPVAVPPTSEFAMTPGDFAEAYGDLGLQFKALQVAFVTEPRLSLYAARVDPPLPSTRDLEPHLATAGRYVGIAGLHRKPWRYRTIDGRVAWERPEDNATVAGTHLYTWAADDFVFLLIGVDDDLNRAMLAALPGERAPAATPHPSATDEASPAASGAEASPSP